MIISGQRMIDGRRNALEVSALIRDTCTACPTSSSLNARRFLHAHGHTLYLTV